MKVSLSFLLTFLLLFLNPAFSADVNYPYGQLRLTLLLPEDPLPGFGNGYSSLSLGMKSALWNPASLGKLNLSESSLSLAFSPASYSYSRTSKLVESSDNFSFGGGTTAAAGRYGIFLRHPQNIGSGIATREVEINSTINYATPGSGINFTSAAKINDWITVGFMANSPLDVDMNLAGNFPVTSRSITNLIGQKMDVLEIQNNGNAKGSFTFGTNTVTLESTQSLWSGFLSQEVTLPLTAFSEFKNDLRISSPYTGTLASKLGNFYLGMNFIPISATANIDNDLYIMVNSDAQNLFFYTPNFDQNNQDEVTRWFLDPDKYAKSDGYLRKQIKVHAGEIVSSARYRGFYTASTARLDLGAIYDLSDYLTLGFALENSSGSTLNFKGSGVSAYLNYRYLDTAEAGSLSDVLAPGGKSTLDPITDRWVTTTEVGGTGLYLESEKNYELPKKLRFGLTFKKPFLVAIDFEQNQTPISLKTTDLNITISNLNLIKIGLESQLFMLPLWFRGGLVLVLKPSITGASSDLQSSINSAFKYRVLPLKLDLGTIFNLWGVEVGDSLSVNALSLFDTLQLNTTQSDLSKLIYTAFYAKKDAWQIDYRLALDPLASVMAYTNRADKNKTLQGLDYLPLLRFIQTLGVTYRF